MATKDDLSDEIEDAVFANTPLSYVTAKISAQQVHELKRGEIRWEAKLDLHGLDIQAARDTLSQFIHEQLQQQKQYVLIHHGLDGIQGGPPLLKNLVNRWLPQFKEVAAFHSAHKNDGGFAAVFVVLAPEIDLELPIRVPGDTYLVEETKSMERKRRLAEQQGERQLAAVKARVHSEEVSSAPVAEGEMQNDILQHPDLDNQRFDGIDPNLNPEPPLNSEARREFDNEQRNQEQEKQLRLGNMPKFTTAPTPRGP